MENVQFQKLLDFGFADRVFSLNGEQWKRVSLSYEAVLNMMKQDQVKVYGIHTGYGANVVSGKDPNNWRTTQSDLLDYLQVGVGDPLPESVVRRGLRLQLLKTAEGHSGIHPQTVERLVKLCNEPTLPSVPSRGSLGASGDLIPMAHAIGAIFDSHPPMGPRDVIGLVNTNSLMASYAIEQWQRVRRLFSTTHEIVALTMRATDAIEDSVSEAVSSLRP